MSVRPKEGKSEPGDIMTGEEPNEERLGEEEDGEESERVRAPSEREAVRRLLDPRSPTQSEVDLHNLMGHIPYRNWCPICVKAQGKDWDHGKSGI